jgi:hypothetical protein
LTVLAEQSTNTLSASLVQFHTAFSQVAHSDTLSNTALQARDHPDQDFYQDSRWTNTLIYLMVASAFGIMVEVLVLTNYFGTKLVALLIPTEIFPSYLPFYITFVIWEFITFSLLLQDISYAQWNLPISFKKEFPKLLIGGCGFIFMGLIVSALFLIIDELRLEISYLLCASAGMYGALSIVFSLVAVRNRDLFS